MNEHALYEALTREYPAPWSLTYHEADEWTPSGLVDMVWNPSGLVDMVTDASGDEVMHLSTFTGDGDRFNLGSAGAVALVAFVNACHRELVADNEAEGEIQRPEGSMP